MASTCSTDELASTLCTASAITPAIRPPNNVHSSQIAIAVSAAVAARRETTDSRIANASQSAMYTTATT